ncbi:MAG: glucose 1-dehydrogenase [bacterium]
MKAPELFSLSGKVAIVTGGSSGLGLMMAEGLAEAGASVVLAARNLERCEAAAEKVRDIGVPAVALRCDVSEPEEVRGLVEQTLQHFDRIDVLINNAGYAWEAPLEEFSLEKWEQTLAVNTTGTFLCSREAGRRMIEQRAGKIINILSVAGLASVDPRVADSVPYSTSKGAIAAFTRDLARKWCRYHVTVNGIAPGYFATRMSRYILEHRREAILNTIPMQRLGEKDEIKGVAVFLASAAADYITGQILAVDGGALA